MLIEGLVPGHAAALGLLCVVGLLIAVAMSLGCTGAASVTDVWGSVKAPPAPEVKAVQVDPRTTALLILDIETRTTNTDRRPRAIASVPRIAELLARARAAGMPVAYSLTSTGTADTILEEVTPREGEPVVNASVDKFHGTELEAFLRQKGVKTVLVVGTAAEGAVLHTATAAAIRGFDVVVAVDCISSSDLYAEQYTAWHLVNAPGSRRRTTLTKAALVEIGQ